MKLRAFAPLLLIACGTTDEDPPVAPEPDAAVPLVVCDEQNLVTTLRALPHVISVDEQGDCGMYVMGPARCFKIDFEQPIQHTAPGGPKLIQQLRLVHRGCDRPTLVADWGYDNDLFFDDELSTLYNTNALWVEHRFQGASVPSDADWDWTALTIKNGAADMHEVVQAFRMHYAQHFVSTGASKGGITATYHHYLYPGDLDGSIPYVAPASRATIDPAYQTYLSGSFFPACAQKLRDAQVAALTTRKSMMKQKLTPSYPGSEQMMLEYMTQSFDWVFWQYYGVQACSYVPSAQTADQAFFDFFYSFSGLANSFAPAGTAEDRAWSALYYEWLTEQGFALQIGAHVRPYITAPQTMEQNFREAQPGVALPAYDGTLTQAVRTWAKDSATNLLLIYGQLDPWSGGAMDAPTQPTSARFFVPNATHGAGLMKLPAAERQVALDHATRMLGVPPVMTMAHLAQAAGANRVQITSQKAKRALLHRLRR
jgi:hypothetical protein